MRRDNFQHVNGMTAKIIAQGIRVAGPLPRDNVQRSAGTQRGKDGRVAQIGGKGGNKGVTQAIAQIKTLQNAVQVIGQLPVFNHHPFGRAG